MLSTLLVLLAPSALEPPFVAPPPAALEEEERTAEVLVSEFRDHVKAKGLEDADAIGVIDEMLQGWEGFDEKERKSIVKELGKCFKAKRKDLAEGVPNDGLFKAAATALGEMGGEDAAEELEDWVDHKLHRKNLALQRELILALGRTRELSGVEPLVDLITDDEPVMQGAAAEALGEYEDADEDVRKDIFEKILKVLAPMHARVQVDAGTDPILRERYNTVAGPMITTLRRLSGHDERDPQEFLHWWNKNKREEWKKGA